MKLVLIVCVILASGVIGFMLKNKYKLQKEFLMFLKNFLEFSLVNVGIYKNNLSEIINNFIIQQKNKNAKYVNFFQNNGKVYTFDLNFVNEWINDETCIYELKSFFGSMGKADKDGEYEKIKREINVLEGFISKAEKQEKEKGDLYFKISLAVGIALGIIIW